jgi:flagellar motor switch protein FliN/FliY
MSVADSSHRDALLRLAAATAESTARVLESFTPGAVQRGGVSVFEEGDAPLAALTRGSVAASVSYIDGVTAAGANIFLMTPAGARRLAGAMGAPQPEAGAGSPLSELELSALAEASNQMMAAASAAIGVVLGQEIKISPPDTRVIDDPASSREHYGSAPHATSTTFTIDGESCRLIQLVPSAFVVRMARALDGLGADGLDADDHGEAGTEASVGLVDALGDIKLRVWAELGRADLPLGDALALPLGAVVELDRPADAPVDLFVNGVCFARGRLIVTDDGEWAFALDDVSGHTSDPRAMRPPSDPVPHIPSGTEEGAVS